MNNYGYFVRPGYISSFEAIKRLKHIICGRNVTLEDHLFFIKIKAETDGEVFVENDLLAKLKMFPYIKIRIHKTKNINTNETIGFCSILEKFVPEDNIKYLENYSLNYGLLISVVDKDNTGCNTEHIESVETSNSKLPDLKISNSLANYLGLTDGETVKVSPKNVVARVKTRLPRIIH